MDQYGVWVSNFTHYFRVLDRAEAMGILLWIRSAEGISDLLRSVVISFSGLVSVSGPGSTFFDQLISQNAVTLRITILDPKRVFMLLLLLCGNTNTINRSLVSLHYVQLQSLSKSFLFVSFFRVS